MNDRPDALRFEGRTAFAQAIHGLVGSALAQQHREMLWVSPGFDDWPLGDAALLDALSAWLKLPQRRLNLLAARFEGLDRSQPALAQWRRWRSHAVFCWQAPAEEASALPCLVWSGGLRADAPQACVQVLHVPTWRGRSSGDLDAAAGGAAAWRWREGVDVVLQRSTPAWPVTTLGI